MAVYSPLFGIATHIILNYAHKTEKQNGLKLADENYKNYQTLEISHKLSFLLIHCFNTKEALHSFVDYEYNNHI